MTFVVTKWSPNCGRLLQNHLQSLLKYYFGGLAPLCIYIWYVWYGAQNSAFFTRVSNILAKLDSRYQQIGTDPEM